MERLESRSSLNFKIGMEILLPCFLLTAVTAMLLFLPIADGEMFGSEGDWYSQHVGAAETLRQTIWETGTIFPQFIGIGGGINAYDLAYYGYLRPDVLLSCLLPDIKMRDIISVYAALGAVASVNLTYFWLKREKLSTWFSIIGGLLMASAACFYHSHHQIIFVNYMPFLILALMGIDRIMEGGKSLLLAISLFLICMHSFFYAPACLVVSFLYYLHQLKETDLTAGEKWKLTARTAISVVAAVGMAAVLLLPTAVDILSTTKDGGRFAKAQIEAVSLTMEGLLYNPYGCGLTMASLYCLLLSLTGRRKRMLSMAVLLMVLIPAAALVLSGFLYARGKVLIPLTPMVVWLCADTLQEIYQGKQKAYFLPLLFCTGPLFAMGGRWETLMWADLGLLTLWVIVRHWKKASKALKKGSLAILLAVPLCFNFGVNRSMEDYLAADDVRQSRFSFGDITMFAEDTRYRFDYLANNYINSNVLPDGSLNKTASYSSVTNSLYGDFYYNTAKNPISLRNRVVLMPNQNLLFNYFMGIRYMLTTEDSIPYGYEKVFSRNGFVLAENPNVLPICYGTDKLVDKKDIAALCGVDKVEISSEELFTGEFPASYSETDDGFVVLPASRSLRKKILILSFDVDRQDGREIEITINGMKNELSGENAPYPNENDRFTFVLTDVENLNIQMTKGKYEINNLKAEVAEIPEVPDDIAIPTIEKDFRGNGRDIFWGSLNMEEDGYFVTSYPWKEGYQVTVDGILTEPERINTAFMGFPLSKGSHRIEISYEAPGFKLGFIISLLSAAVLALQAVIEYLRQWERKKTS